MENVLCTFCVLSKYLAVSGAKENGPAKVAQGSQAGPFQRHALCTKCPESYGNTLTQRRAYLPSKPYLL